MDRSYDHGQTAPFSYGLWAESNGEPFEYDGHVYGLVRGDVIRLGEWYGADRKEVNRGIELEAGLIGAGIKQREVDWGIWGRVRPGPADNNIFSDYNPGSSVAGDMLEHDIEWTRSDKSAGSRKLGWEKIRSMLGGSVPKHGLREQPGLFVCERCVDFRRTMPVLPRSNKDLDDVDTNAEDHIGDEVRYRLRRKIRSLQVGDF